MEIERRLENQDRNEVKHSDGQFVCLVKKMFQKKQQKSISVLRTFSPLSKCSKVLLETNIYRLDYSVGQMG